MNPSFRVSALLAQQQGDLAGKLPIYLTHNDNVVILLSSCNEEVTSYQKSCYTVITTPTIKDPRPLSNVINNKVLHSLFIHSRLTHTYLSV